MIEFETEEEFTRLLQALARELVDANIHWRLYRDLTASIKPFSRELNQSPAFWSLTFRAHLNATIFCLIRIYDGNSRSLSLRNLLGTISANLNIFDEERFRERLKDNPYVESLAEDVRKPDEKQLETDIAFASSESNDLVKNVTVWRNNLFAHRNAEDALKGNSMVADYPLSEDEIGLLASTGIEILNRYSSLFSAETHSTQIVGHDDYQAVLGSVRVHLKQMDEALEKERRWFEAIDKKGE